MNVVVLERPRADALDTQRVSEGAFARRLSLILPLVLIGSGTLLRLRQYLVDRAIWGDEAALALNLVARDYAGLLGGLDHDQAAPVLFLWACKTAVNLLGVHEWSLRLVPFVAGVASLPLTYLVGRRLVGTAPAMVALALVALTQPSIYYAAEFKQYATDALVAIGLLGLVSGMRRPMGWRRALWLGVAGAAAVWAAHPAVFVLAGAGVTALVVQAAARDWRGCLRSGLVAAGWAASFGANYLVSLRTTAADVSFQQYWEEWLAPFPWQSVGDLWWFPRTLQSGLVNPFGLLTPEFAKMAIVCMVVGSVVLWRERRVVLGLLVAPAGFMVVASMMAKYPMYGRFLLYLVPSMALLIGVGVVWLARILPGRGWVVGAAALTALLLVPATTLTAEQARDPLWRTEVRPAMRHARTHWQEGDRMYVYGGWRNADVYWADRIGIPTSARVGAMDKTEKTLSDLDQLVDYGRVWVVLPEASGQVLARLDELGTRRDDFREMGRRVVLYEMRGRGEVMLAG